MTATAPQPAPPQVHFVDTPTLRIGYRDQGPRDALPIVLMHGFPFDVHAFDEAEKLLTAAGCRTITPYLRGYGPTRFHSADAMRSGEQASIGQDLIDLLDALRLQRATLAGFDWGARAACIVAALWPERVQGLVTCGGYQIQNLKNASDPVELDQEYRFWYQHYLQTERGRAGLDRMRAPMARMLWRQWSPTWRFDEATFALTAPALDNPDYVDIVVHSYRHRMGFAAGDPAHAALQQRLAAMPRIPVPSITLHGDSDEVIPMHASAEHSRFFSGPYERRILPGVGHNPPQEAPALFVDAVLAVHRRQPSKAS